MRTHFFGALALALSDESYKRILVQELSNLSSERCRRGRSRAPARAGLKDADGLLPSHLLQGGAAGDHPRRVEGGVLEDGVRAAQFGAQFAPRNSAQFSDAPASATGTPAATCSGCATTRRGCSTTPTSTRRTAGTTSATSSTSRSSTRATTCTTTSPSTARSRRASRSASVHGPPLRPLLHVRRRRRRHRPPRLPRPQPAGGAARVAADEGQRGLRQLEELGGDPQFPDAVRVMLRASSALQDESYVPLEKFESTPSTGGLTLLDGKTIGDFNHLDLARRRTATLTRCGRSSTTRSSSRAARGRATPSAPRSGRAASCAGRRGRAGPAAHGARAVGEPDLLLRAGGDGELLYFVP